MYSEKARTSFAEAYLKANRSYFKKVMRYDEGLYR
jgi:hypothetical protein